MTDTLIRPTLFGRNQEPESLNVLAEWTHVAKDETLKEVDHSSPLGILDQEDLLAQGIDVSAIVKGAQKGTDALGSCTMNATTAKLAGLLSPADFLALGTKLSGVKVPAVTSMDDVKGAEELAIGLYHLVTWLTGQPSEEWPTQDCGSSGPYIVQLLQKLKLITGAKIAHGTQNLVSLLQQGSVLQGTPFLNDWMEPDSNGFVDGNGSASTVESQIRDGVAGGHETLIEQVEKLTLTETGQVVPHQTVFVVRNSWTKSWGDEGHFRIHASTLATLGTSCDFRLLVAA